MGINVLSLFDGMSCGRVALKRIGIEVNKYYSSEIDKYAIQIADKNYPMDTIHRLGDVTKWQKWDIDWSNIDLLIGGSPCQGFSFAGKQLNFEDSRSKLFFEFVRILEEIKIYNPNVYFLLENVKMKKEYQDIISSYLGVKPIEINSALVSAQNRKRLYWTNIPGIKQPENKNIYLKDIIEKGFVDRDKSYCLDANYFKGGNLTQYFEKKRRQLVFDKPLRIQTYGKGGQGQRIYAPEGKSVTLSALGGGRGAKTGLYLIGEDYRKLTPIECERLQTLPDNYTEGVSNSQRYKMLGNGWTVDVIAHILSFLPNEFKIKQEE